jgi:hypothetical protein
MTIRVYQNRKTRHIDPMRLLSCSILVSLAFSLSGTAASLREDQITAQELAEELGFSTRKIILPSMHRSMPRRILCAWRRDKLSICP